MLFDEPSSWSQMLFFVLKLVVFSFLTPPSIKHAKETQWNERLRRLQPEPQRETFMRCQLFLAQFHATLMNFYRQTLAEGRQELSKAVGGTVKEEFWFKSPGEQRRRRRRQRWEEQTDSWKPTAALKLKSITVVLYGWLSSRRRQSLIQEHRHARIHTHCCPLQQQSNLQSPWCRFKSCGRVDQSICIHRIIIKYYRVESARRQSSTLWFYYLKMTVSTSFLRFINLQRGEWLPPATDRARPAGLVQDDVTSACPVWPGMHSREGAGAGDQSNIAV